MKGIALRLFLAGGLIAMGGPSAGRSLRFQTSSCVSMRPLEKPASPVFVAVNWPGFSARFPAPSQAF
jgi:hypothetical protein